MDGDRIDTDQALVNQVLWARLRALMDEAGATLRRTAFSFPTRESNDFAACLMDTHGDSVAQSIQSIPSFLSTLPLTTKAILEVRPKEKWRPGDAMLTNDPWLGAGHLPDVTIVQPVFWRDRLVSFAGAITHISDVGGTLFGGQTREIFEEGLRFAPTLIQTAEGPNETFFGIIRTNTRVPDEVIGDLHALMSANDAAARGVCQLLDEGELKDLDAFGAYVKDRCEIAMRDAIRRIPNGTYRAEVTADGYDEPIPLKCEITVSHEDIVIDYTGSSPQVPWPLNGVHNFTYAYTVYPLKCAIAPEVPNNSGTLRPFRVEAPVGSVLNGKHPAPVGLRHINGQLLQAMIYRALQPVMPERVIAASGSPSAIAVLSGRKPDGEGFVIYLFLAGGMGARHGRDGVSTVAFPATVTNVPAEVAEEAAPVRIERKEYRLDSAGPGRTRGGFGQEVRVRNVSDLPITVSMLTDRHRFAPQGLDGGGEGAKGEVFLESGEPARSKGHTMLKPGDCLVIRTPGGAGYGDAAQRPAEFIARDVAAGFRPG
ncbi:hydantoinase B/oxoprolinase family protein [Falsiroseomonas sp. HW251]|uniref:hydantoinase B/oxoprolinase family protein n=1 Tax=Falsiroseomonas sp. HW251 TaxID=3390998 RepID=UPI003D31C400